MHSITQGIVQELQSLLQIAKEMQSRYLSEILSLQKVLNRTQKCVPALITRQGNKEPVKANRQQTLQLSIQEKVKALMEDVQIRQKNIECEKQEKPKYEVKPPQIVLEKKPPLPTINRNEKAIRNQPPAYVPPRNRNQVTGKVTQTNFRTSGQKVARSDKSVRRVDNKEVAKQNERSVQKKVEKKIEPLKKNTEDESRMQSPPLPTIYRPTPQKIVDKKPVQPTTHHQYVKFASFHKQIQQILEQIVGECPKNHKKQLQKLLVDCETEEKGHRMHQQTNRKLFIKKVNNFALSRHAVLPMSSFQTARNKWHYRPDLADMHLLLDGLLNQLQGLQLQQDCRIDKKTQFRIAQSALFYSQTIQQMRQDSQRANMEVPEKLDLTFSFTQQQFQKSEDESADLQKLTELSLNDQLLQLLQEIGEKGSLEKNELRSLQVLAQLGIFRSKRTPLIIMQKEYTSWKDHYADLNNS